MPTRATDAVSGPVEGEEVATLEGLQARAAANGKARPTGLGSAQLGFGGQMFDTDQMVAGDLQEYGLAGSWVKVVDGTINQERKLIGIRIEKPRWYTHPYVIGGAVGLAAGYLISKVL